MFLADVHNAEFVLTGVLTQTLDYESYPWEGGGWAPLSAQEPPWLGHTARASGGAAGRLAGSRGLSSRLGALTSLQALSRLLHVSVRKSVLRCLSLRKEDSA